MGEEGRGAARSRSAHFSPIMMLGALVLPVVMLGMTEASATRSPVQPCTRRSGPTTAAGLSAGPMRQVPTGWYSVSALRRSSRSMPAGSSALMGESILPRQGASAASFMMASDFCTPLTRRGMSSGWLK